MSHQKQQSIDSQEFNDYSNASEDGQSGKLEKRKHIQKQNQRIQVDKKGVYQELSKKRKETAKEVKRIREQNRRANHK